MPEYTRPLVSIDKDNLDREVEEQSDKYLDYAEMLAEARAEYDAAKAKFEVVEAEAELDIRNRPGKYKIKLTEASVKAAIKLHPARQKAQRVVNARKRAVGMFEAAVNALEQRKRMLEKDCDLWAAGYFARVRLPEATAEHVGGARKKKLRSKRRAE